MKCIIALTISLISESLLADDRPNILLIMSDDLGYSDIGSYGGEINTPNLDALAENGIRLTQFKTTGRCCPSRASLMTGRYAHAVGMGWMTAVDENRPGYRGQVYSDVPFISEILKESGYKTYFSGKWHLTVDGAIKSADKGYLPNGSWPFQRGFDESFGILTGGNDYYNTTFMFRNQESVSRDSLAEDWYLTHGINNASVDYIKSHDFNDAPLFLYLAHFAPHRPLQAPESRIEKYMEQYRVGYDVLRVSRFEKMKELGIVSDNATLPDLEAEYLEKRPDWESLTSEQQDQWIREMATYAAMVEIMDDGIGDVINALKEKNALENTLVIFISDNGATEEGGLISKLAADLSNTPYRSYKRYNYGGGISSPAILSWPAKLGEFANELRADVTHIIDIVPTLVDVTWINTDTSFDGVSIFEVMLGYQLPERHVFFEHEGNAAVIYDDWKLVSKGFPIDWELYNIKRDPFEQKNLETFLPAQVYDLHVEWVKWAEKNHVLPLETAGWSDRIKHYKTLYPEQSGPQ